MTTLCHTCRYHRSFFDRRPRRKSCTPMVAQRGPLPTLRWRPRRHLVPTDSPRLIPRRHPCCGSRPAGLGPRLLLCHPSPLQRRRRRGPFSAPGGETAGKNWWSCGRWSVGSISQPQAGLRGCRWCSRRPVLRGRRKKTMTTKTKMKMKTKRGREQVRLGRALASGRRPVRKHGGVVAKELRDVMRETNGIFFGETGADKRTVQRPRSRCS